MKSRLAIALSTMAALVLVALQQPAGAAKDGPRSSVLDGELPISGTRVPELDAFDQTMQKFMRERHIKAGVLAVMRDGRLYLSRGYGHADRDGTRRVAPEDPFRIASITKPFTAAAIVRLIRDGKIKRDDKAFAFLEVMPPPGAKPDPRLKNVTIQHLLDHKGGWDREAAFDPMFASRKVAQALGKTGPASCSDIVRYMTGQPLQFDPGTKKAYSNFGYCVLGRIIEKATGQRYIDYLQEAILEPLEIKSVQLGHTLPKKRRPHEPFYADPGKGPSVFDSQQIVPAPDGTFYLEALDSHGGLIASAPDLVRFGEAYWLDGEPRLPSTRIPTDSSFMGSLPGTYSLLLQRADGLVIAAIFNQRADASGLDYAKIRDLLGATADRIKQWPSAAKPRSEELSRAVVKYCQSQIGKKVGRGECAELACYALRSVEGRYTFKDDPGNTDYVWGELIYRVEANKGKRSEHRPEDRVVRPGDIMQFRDAAFEGPHGKSGSPHHTAIVIGVKEKGEVLAVLEQNVGADKATDEERKKVKNGTYYLKELKEGWVRVYRPVPR